jgi:hypothetical protein
MMPKTEYLADKPAVRDFDSKLTPLLKALRPMVKKYWLHLCCSDTGHLTNYSVSSYLLALGMSFFVPREFIICEESQQLPDCLS